jgi:hypothetical protein
LLLLLLLLLLLEEAFNVAVSATNELATRHDIANVGEGTEADEGDNLVTAAQVAAQVAEPSLDK